MGGALVIGGGGFSGRTSGHWWVGYGSMWEELWSFIGGAFWTHSIIKCFAALSRLKAMFPPKGVQHFATGFEVQYVCSCLVGVLWV